MSKQKILVIGGLGFIGFHIVKELKQQGFEVTIGSRRKKTEQVYSAPVVQVDLNEMTDSQLRNILRPFDSIVFAGGADDRSIPKGDVDQFFYDGNVRPCVRIATLSHQLELRQLVILGSYFSHFARIKPEWKMIERHPYLKSRKLQLEETTEATSKKMHVSVLEIPYVFGSAPGIIPLWKPLVDYVGNSPIILYTNGGTNMVAVEQVAQAVVGILTTSVKRAHWLMVGENLSWKKMINLISSSVGKTKKVYALPNFAVRIAAFFTKLFFNLTGKNSGLDPYYFIETQTSETFLHDEEGRIILAYDRTDIKASINQTVQACQNN